MNKKCKLSFSKSIISLMLAISLVYCYSPFLKIQVGMPSIMLKAVQIVCMVLFSIGIYRLLNKAWGITEKREEILERSASMDLVRTVAAFLVVLVHSFITIGYYDMPLQGTNLFYLTILRWIAVDCVPLFMIITGYLCGKYTDIKATYLKIIPVYLLYAFVIIIAKILRAVLGQEGFTIGMIVRDITSLRLSWYVEMYLGLVLLIPFFNILWKELEHSQKKILVTVLIVLSGLSTIYAVPLPDFWACLYPITYYFVGLYLKEYPIKMSVGIMAIIFVFITLSEAVLTLHNEVSKQFYWGLFGDYDCNYNAIIVLASAVLLFSILMKVKIKAKPLIGFLKIAGKNTLGIYLISSSIVDVNLQLYFSRLYTNELLFKLQIPMVLLSFFISLGLAIILNLFISSLMRIIKIRK